jgi:hypothetical protein
LETACQEAGGLGHVRDPQGIEHELIRVLENLTSTILPDFFGDTPLPQCNLIDADRASWEGMAATVRLSEPRTTHRGLTIRYQLPWVALKKSVLTNDGFQRALSTYLHELAHCFGGDQSAQFSLALTHILQTTLGRGEEIARAKATWHDLHSSG